ncbi:hypothetical protein [Bradyrhizobium elkanii]|uniref:hypothetical protein n=1 Tax=Bradyrhizobium elkanii TaxID=29448 RepID=UPI003F82212E
MLFVLELGDRELHLLDQQRAGADLGFEIACLNFICSISSVRARTSASRLRAFSPIALGRLLTSGVPYARREASRFSLFVLEHWRSSNFIRAAGQQAA